MLLIVEMREPHSTTTCGTLETNPCLNISLCNFLHLLSCGYISPNSPRIDVHVESSGYRFLSKFLEAKCGVAEFLEILCSTYLLYYLLDRIHPHKLCFTFPIKCVLTGVNGSFPFSTASMFFIANSSNPMWL